MPRNIARTLAPADKAVQRVRQFDLESRKAAARPVRVTYRKRDNSVSSSTGLVGDFSGVPGMDTGSVTILTEDKGPRTINLHRITAIE